MNKKSEYLLVQCRACTYSTCMVHLVYMYIKLGGVPVKLCIFTADESVPQDVHCPSA